MLKPSKDVTKEELASILLERERIRQLYLDAGIPFTDSTKENLGKSVVMFINSQNEAQTDEAETCLRNLNRSKSKNENT
jgi:hypothetical protein